MSTQPGDPASQATSSLSETGDVHATRYGPTPPAPDPAATRYTANPQQRAPDYAFMDPPQMPDEIGRVGDFRVLRLLGKGGMGMVFEVEDSKLKRRTALKVMQDDMACDERARQRFLREARAAAAIEHEHVVSVLQVGEHRGVPFLVMPLLKGESLESRLGRSPPLTFAEILRVGREVALGLAAAHAAELIHRDIKPSNLWLEETPNSVGRVKVLDFGLARPMKAADKLTDTDTMLGTAGYMSPEQARADLVDARTDLFSLGCVLYRLCTGRLPFDGTTLAAVLTKLATHDPPPSHVVEPRTPRALSALVARLLQRNPASRPASAAEVAECLRTIEQTLAADGQRLRSRSRTRRPWMISTASTLALMIVAALACAFFPPRRNTTTSPGNDVSVRLETPNESQTQVAIPSAPPKGLNSDDSERLKQEAAAFQEQALDCYRAGKLEEATALFERALSAQRTLFPPEEFPDGHPALVMCLNNLGVVLHARDENAKAEPFAREALEMNRRLYPTRLYPNGHPEIATALSNLGGLLQAQGKYGDAEPLLRDALAINRRLYPKSSFPTGHPALVRTLLGLGAVLEARGAYREAVDILHEGLIMHQSLCDAIGESSSEGEFLDFLAAAPRARDAYLAATAMLTFSEPADYYPVLWQGKAPLTRALEFRHRLLCNNALPDVRSKAQELLDIRRQLGRLVFSSPQTDSSLGDSERQNNIRELSSRKEQLEKKIAGLLPRQAREEPPFTALADALPEHAAFIDLYRYQISNPGTGKSEAEKYSAFILRKGQPLRRVELDGAPLIEKDLSEWRKDINAQLVSDAANRLRERVWLPLVKQLGDATTIYVAPDGPLDALPWAALPGARPGCVLLEDFNFALVLHGPFLLEQLASPPEAGTGSGVMLVVGGVRYDRPGAPSDKVGRRWLSLPATDNERVAVAAAAKKRHPPADVLERASDGADVERILQDLPKVRWAHLATHGFYAAPHGVVREHLFGHGEWRGTAERNPLLLCGLVLSGANQPSERNNGVLTGEVVAGLPLDGLELAVLSACDSGVGESVGGEGSFDLKRAFHLAGARNVVASLWAVDDEATAALMNLFYYHLWDNGESTLEALRHAQLEVYRNPQFIPDLARPRGAKDWDETVQAISKQPTDPNKPPKNPARIRDWAAFVLSGSGR